MASHEEIYRLLIMIEQMHNTFPTMLTEISQLNCGSIAVTRYLYDKHRSNETVHASDLSRYLGVSTARMTAMLKKMEKNQLIVRGKESSDARATTIRLSEKGLDYAQHKRQQIEKLLAQMIDRLGYQKMSELVQTVCELCAAFSTEKCCSDLMN